MSTKITKQWKSFEINNFCEIMFVLQFWGMEYCSKHHGVGFARKSVSFCQRDNVHVYDTVDYEHDEIEGILKNKNAGNGNTAQ